MEPITLTIVVTYVSLKFIDQFIKEEGYGRLRRFIFPENKYKHLLEYIIHETICEYELTNPYNPLLYQGKPFYYSKELFDHFNNYLLISKTQISNDELLSKLKNDSSLILPTKDQLASFYKLFVSKVKKEPRLKKLYINENYQDKIFEIARSIDSIKEDTVYIKAAIDTLVISEKSRKLTPVITLAALKRQVDKQLAKQINSEKYLKNTFIETGEQKDSLRYLCDPIFYAEKCFVEINMMDLRVVNDFLVQKSHPSINIDFEQFNPSTKPITISNSSQIFDKWYFHLKEKEYEFNSIKIASMERLRIETKFKIRINYVSFLKARVAIITEMAGQGKTNFLCDFTENFLTKRTIPTIFLTGPELNSSDLRQSILRKIFPDTIDFSFADLLLCIKDACYKDNKLFIVIIDAINENANPQEFSKSLEELISELLDYDFIRIVLSCRTEYYIKNFQTLEKSSFKNDIQKVESLMSQHLDEELKNKILNIYFEYFGINWQRISNKAFNVLTRNFLLLRIFCDTYKNRNIEFIDNIYKEDLFESYYSFKSEEINIRLKGNDEYKLTGTFDIKNFIQTLVELMIETKCYVNIKLDSIIDKTQNKTMYVRFLDENILVRKDILPDEKGVFNSPEVVNFTFDEFRDYLISSYLIKILYTASPEKFVSFIESELVDKSPLLEGCGTFLFFISRKAFEENLNKILTQQIWFDKVYLKNIFLLDETLITKYDVTVLKEKLNNNSPNNSTIILKLLNRYKIDEFKNLNINLLLEVLILFDDFRFKTVFASLFDQKNSTHSPSAIMSDIVLIIKRVEPTNILDHRIFEFLIYIFGTKDSLIAKSIYLKYYRKNEENGKLQLKNVLKCNCELLKSEVSQFIQTNDIKI